jgi:hypothetical protein
LCRYVAGFHRIDVEAEEAHWCAVIAQEHQREGLAREAWEASCAYAKTQVGKCSTYKPFYPSSETVLPVK